MSMTEDQILIDVTSRWTHENLGLYQKAVGFYIVQMQQHFTQIHNDYFDDTTLISNHMLWILAYDWNVLRWYSDLPGSDPEGGPVDAYSASPKPDELDEYPLTITGVTWAGLLKDDYVMMVESYLHDLSRAWQDDTATFWSQESEDQARYLFEVCKQYLLEYGIAEG
jgi:hypothetical protein